MSDQNPEPQSKSPNKIKPPPGCVDSLYTLEPTDEVIAHLKSVIYDYKLEFVNLTDSMKRCEEIIKTKHQHVDELQKCHQEISKLKESYNNLNLCLYQEYEKKYSLSDEKDELEIKIARAKNEIESLLKQCGDKKTQKTVDLTCESQKPLFVLKKDSPESRDQNEAKDMQQNAIRDPPELLELKIKSLTDQLQIRTNIHEDYVQALLKDKNTHRQNYISDLKRFDTQINLVASSLKETDESTFPLFRKLRTARNENEQKEMIWLNEKDKLVQELESCKKRSGKEKKVLSPTQKVLQKLQDKVDTLEKQLSDRDKFIAAYQTQYKELKVEFGSVKHQLDVSHNEAKEMESKMAEELNHYKSELKDIESKYCLEREGYKNDIKSLNERLKSLEKQDENEKLPDFK